jgi:hypothetical protein
VGLLSKSHSVGGPSNVNPAVFKSELSHSGKRTRIILSSHFMTLRTLNDVGLQVKEKTDSLLRSIG